MEDGSGTGSGTGAHAIGEISVSPKIARAARTGEEELGYFIVISFARGGVTTLATYTPIARLGVLTALYIRFIREVGLSNVFFRDIALKGSRFQEHSANPQVPLVFVAR